MRILVRTPNWIGDQVLAYPFFVGLRETYPEAWIAVVCPAWVKDLQYMGLVDEVIPLPAKKGSGLMSRLRLILDLSKTIKNKGPWDLGITLPNSFGTALLLWLAGCRSRRGYATDARGFLLTQRMPWDPSPNIHRSQAYLNLLSLENKNLFDAKSYWQSGRETQFDDVRHWATIPQVPAPEERYFVIAPGATAPSRRWSEVYFADLIRYLHESWNAKAVIVGGPAEKKLSDYFVNQGLPVLNYVASGSVAGLVEVFRGSRLTITNESGLAHVAALCGSSVQIICGAADPKRTTPIGPGTVWVKTNPISCWPCEKNYCRLDKPNQNKCHVEIQPAQVAQEIFSRGN